MRHGAVDIEIDRAWINGAEFPQLLVQYDQSTIRADSEPAKEALERFSDHFIVSSDLIRAIASAQRFHPNAPQQRLAIFREVDGAYLAIAWLKLSPKLWAVLFILMWLAGLFAYKQSIREAKQRAELAADVLEQLAEQHGKVLLLGHGFMNIYIARVLRQRGWLGPKTPAKRHWEFGVYTAGLSAQPTVSSSV